MRFDRAYCSYPICNASRVSFLSGRQPDTTRVFGNGTQPRSALGAEFQFLPEYFLAQGHFIAGIGKVAREGLEGTSFAPLLDDPQRSWKRAAFCVVSRVGAKDLSVWEARPVASASAAKSLRGNVIRSVAG